MRLYPPQRKAGFKLYAFGVTLCLPDPGACPGSEPLVPGPCTVIPSSLWLRASCSSSAPAGGEHRQRPWPSGWKGPACGCHPGDPGALALPPAFDSGLRAASLRRNQSKAMLLGPWWAWLWLLSPGARGDERAGGCQRLPGLRAGPCLPWAVPLNPSLPRPWSWDCRGEVHVQAFEGGDKTASREVPGLAQGS